VIKWYSLGLEVRRDVQGGGEKVEQGEDTMGEDWGGVGRENSGEVG
jgi:hypothetical protein